MNSQATSGACLELDEPTQLKLLFINKINPFKQAVIQPAMTQLKIQRRNQRHDKVGVIPKWSSGNGRDGTVIRSPGMNNPKTFRRRLHR